MTEVTVEIANPRRRKKRWQRLKVIADTGAIFTVFPKSLLRHLGISAYSEEEFRVADGRRISRRLGDVLLKIDGKERTVPVIFGEATDAPLLGVTALEILGFTIDPRTRKLKPTEMLLL